MSRSSKKRQASKLARDVELNKRFPSRHTFLTTKAGNRSVFQTPIRRKPLKSIDSRYIVPSIDLFTVYPNSSLLVWENLSEKDRQSMSSEVYNQTTRFGRKVIATTKTNEEN